MFLLHVEKMNNEKFIKELVEEKLAEIGGFIVDIVIHPNNKVLILIDKEEGLNVKDCAQVSRFVEHRLEDESNDLLSTHGLEVSSPGLDYPLKHLKQYIKNIGRKIQVTSLEGVEKTGVLKDVAEDAILLEEEKKVNKKIEKEDVKIPFLSIKEAKIVISFK